MIRTAAENVRYIENSVIQQAVTGALTNIWSSAELAVLVYIVIIIDTSSKLKQKIMP
jgi:hypothetical protein